MPQITIKVEPKDRTAVGWDVFCLSWKADFTKQTVHRLTWSTPSSGVFVATTGDLPSGVYGIHCAVVGVGRKVDVTVVGEPTVLQPVGSSWPMTVEVDGATSTRASDTWYFQSGV